jgi:protein gp37
MAENSKIEWTNHTANLYWGCTHVHSGCDNCYAEAWSKRFDGGKSVWGNDNPRREIKSVWKDLKRYQKLAKESEEIHRVFVGSMMDIFEKPMPLIYKGDDTGITTEEIRQIFFHDVVPNSPNLLFLLLTKRPSNINKYIPENWKTNPPENVMFGTSIVDQPTTDNLVPQLLKVKGKKFLSVEPQLSELSLSQYLQLNQINWVIEGGESGPKKRSFNIEWARRLRDECERFKVPYFFKQIDKIREIPSDLQIRQFPI